ncbi:sigma-54 dependent transcriptional regulator [Desulforapulum autotrophicum HRM2]|uniref:Sigma-54 dependent transcriptional regulator n=1 Tax=Desulforapulum autotrophicum (strain ATCC 43914 / DSM 3382 / VKM B-1955 / HRM2) TaxID=177437 RepID=C0QI94_DESAH|nr:sigma-54-dependent Fis family transcriptional regulator [Desulforapulum autotrophicum]ACN15830.1 sigma-54 dependent transcriptional regulator [Desulforapulum autotrophicum HRM2]
MTEKRQTQVVLNQITVPEDQVELYLRIFDSIQNGIIITDPNGYITYLNRSYGRFLNIDPEQQIGRHCSEVIENSRMHIVGRTGRPELNQIQKINGITIVVERIPVKRAGRVIAVFGRVMFDDVKSVTKLAEKIDDLKTKVKCYERKLLALSSTRFTFDSILGKSDILVTLKEQAKAAAANSLPVLITGKSGTGKELFAQAIHSYSLRKRDPFVKINCAAIPKDLLESEFFGYDEGAFSGARKKGKPGKLELADGGTLFLDEIGDLALEMQPKILRAIEEREFERVGGIKVIQSDFRVIAATNRNLETMVKEKSFRSDLFYRLNVIPLHVPPLRERRCDILLLSEAFLIKIAAKTGRLNIKLGEKAKNCLSSYHWPGNVRELVNVLERTVANLNGDTIHAKDLPAHLHGKGKNLKKIPTLCLHDLQQTAEKLALKQALAETGNNKSRAARKLGIHRTLLYKKLKKHNIPLG